MSDATTPLGDFSRGTLIELWHGVIMKDAFVARDALPGDLVAAPGYVMAQQWLETRITGDRCLELSFISERVSIALPSSSKNVSVMVKL